MHVSLKSLPHSQRMLSMISDDNPEQRSAVDIASGQFKSLAARVEKAEAESMKNKKATPGWGFAFGSHNRAMTEVREALKNTQEDLQAQVSKATQERDSATTERDQANAAAIKATQASVDAAKATASMNRIVQLKTAQTAEAVEARDEALMRRAAADVEAAEAAMARRQMEKELWNCRYRSRSAGRPTSATLSASSSMSVGIDSLAESHLSPRRTAQCGLNNVINMNQTIHAPKMYWRPCHQGPGGK